MVIWWCFNIRWIRFHGGWFHGIYKLKTAESWGWSDEHPQIPGNFWCSTGTPPFASLVVKPRQLCWLKSSHKVTRHIPFCTILWHRNLPVKPPFHPTRSSWLRRSVPNNWVTGSWWSRYYPSTALIGMQPPVKSACLLVEPPFTGWFSQPPFMLKPSISRRWKNPSWSPMKSWRQRIQTMGGQWISLKCNSAWWFGTSILFSH